MIKFNIFFKKSNILILLLISSIISAKLKSESIEKLGRFVRNELVK